MIIHYHTQFGKKWLSSSGDIDWPQSDTQTELQTDRPMDGLMEKMIQIYIPPTPMYLYGGRGEQR